MFPSSIALYGIEMWHITVESRIMKIRSNAIWYGRNYEILKDLRKRFFRDDVTYKN